MIQQKQVELNFSFKGDRDYIQGTDMYTKIHKILVVEEGFTLVKLRFTGLLRSNAKLVWNTGGDMPVGDPIHCATGEFIEHNGRTRTFAVIPIPQSSIHHRYSYHEENIISKVVLEDRSALIDELTEFSLIEELVASIKYLSNVITPPKSGKWLFAGIQQRGSMPLSRHEGQTLKVIQRQIVANRFSRNEALLDGKVLSTIEFSVGGK